VFATEKECAIKRCFVIIELEEPIPLKFFVAFLDYFGLWPNVREQRGKAIGLKKLQSQDIGSMMRNIR